MHSLLGATQRGLLVGCRGLRLCGRLVDGTRLSRRGRTMLTRSRRRGSSQCTVVHHYCIVLWYLQRIGCLRHEMITCGRLQVRLNDGTGRRVMRYRIGRTLALATTSTSPDICVGIARRIVATASSGTITAWPATALCPIAAGCVCWR